MCGHVWAEKRKMRHKWQIHCRHVLKISRYELFDTYCIHTLDGELCITSSLNHNQYVSIGIRPQPFRRRKPKLCRNLWIYLTTRGGKHLISWFWHRAEPPRYLDMRNSQREAELQLLGESWGLFRTLLHPTLNSQLRVLWKCSFAVLLRSRCSIQ